MHSFLSFVLCQLGSLLYSTTDPLAEFSTTPDTQVPIPVNPEMLQRYLLHSQSRVLISFIEAFLGVPFLSEFRLLWPLLTPIFQ